MPLLVENAAVENIGLCFSGGLKPLQERLSRFLDSPAIALSPEELLYICQGEYGALLPHTECLRYIGSDDATTCHIVVLRHSGSGAVCLSHLDGTGTAKAVDDMVALLIDLSGHLSGRIELHIFGGFLDPRGLSRILSMEILDAFQRCSVPVHLMTACMTDSNDVIRNGLHFPVIYGIGVDVSTGTIFKATFSQKLPEITLRSSRNVSDRQEVVKVFDNRTNTLRIEPYTYQRKLYLESWLSLPNDVILSSFSTSPEQEPPDFVDHIRDVIRFTAANPEPMQTVFPGGTPVVYKMTAGKWVKTAHEVLGS